MKPAVPKPHRCAIYTRKSTAHNLDLEFNSLDAQREACEAYIKSQPHEGWRLVPDRYDDGGLSGASLDRPSLQNLLADVRAGKITIVVVYKVDRLTRSRWSAVVSLQQSTSLMTPENAMVSVSKTLSFQEKTTELSTLSGTGEFGILAPWVVRGLGARGPIPARAHMMITS
jgi:Resolvase, N terminal domain